MDYQVVIIGGGPGGYVCAIRCAQLGLRTALVERAAVGGTCLNWGCIPTKALVSATKLVERASTADEMGIVFGAPTIDLSKLATWKAGVVSTLVGGIETLLDKNGVELLRAEGRLDGPGRVVLADGTTVTSERVVLATGSSPIEIPGFSFDDPRVWSSNDALALTEVPERLVVIGGGVIGLELASIYNRLGSAVTVLELLPEILSVVDLDRRVVATLKRSLKLQGIDVRTGTAAQSIEDGPDGFAVLVADGDPIPADRVLLAVGRHPNTAALGIETVGIEPDKRGLLPVNEALRCSTDAGEIYAIGDVAPGPMLAHKASAEGVALAEAFAGGEMRTFDHASVAQAIFTDPEIASVGLSEMSAKERGHDILVGRFPYAALGRALGMREPNGFFQVVADAADHRILGAAIVGADASELISEAAVAIESRLTLEAIADAIHPHPTLPEGLKEAAENALGRAIHTVNR
jgi:dihydrolipoamide dehydrogenase